MRDPGRRRRIMAPPAVEERTPSPSEQARMRAAPAGAEVPLPEVARPGPGSTLWWRLGRAQPKLSVGGDHEPAEREADRVAAEVVDRPRSGVDRPIPGPVHAPLGSTGTGTPLDGVTRGVMERGLGASFGDVRVHTGPDAAGAARSMSSRAFTVGNDIAFGAGQYRPHTDAGLRLLAHELTHVVQQRRGGTPGVIRRQPEGRGGGDASTGSGSGGGLGRSSGGGTATTTSGQGGATAAPQSTPQVRGGKDVVVAGGPADPFVVELKGKPFFSPSADLAAVIQVARNRPVTVHVRFGSVADGYIPVYWGTPPSSPDMPYLPDQPPTGYQTPAPPTNLPAWEIPLVHPAFRALPRASPVLWIRIRDSVVSGGMGWKTPMGLAQDPQRFKQMVGVQNLFAGLDEFEDLRVAGEITNSLWEGRFRYGAEKLVFHSGAFEGTGRLRVTDETYELDAGFDVPVAGLPSDARVPVHRKTTSFFDTLHIAKTWRFDRRLGGSSGGLLSGSITGSLGHGRLEVRGAVRYANRDPKITGTVTVLVTSFDIARQRVLDKLGPDAPTTAALSAPTIAAPSAPGQKLAVTGWGELDFAVNEWLTGSAEVIVHPEGWVTARGELLPTKVIGLLRHHAKDVEIGTWDPPPILVAGVPGVGHVRADASATLTAYGWIGPGALHDLRATGLLSNHPAIVNRFDVGGTFSAPAAAGLRLVAKVGLSGHFAHIVELVSVSVKGTGIAELQLFAEAAALIGRRASKAGPAAAEYFVKGHLAAHAELLLKLKLDLEGRVALWRPKLHLVDEAWSLGSGAAGADFEYVLGRPDASSFAIDFGKVDFDATKFAQAVARGETLKEEGFTGKAPADTQTTSGVAAGPQSPQLPGPPATGTPGPGTARLTKEVEAPFSMLTEPHVLRLSLLGQPDLQMQSPAPKSLLNRIKRTRAELRRAPPPDPEELQAHLEDLRVLEEMTAQVLEAAGRVAPESPYLTPSVPGFTALAAAISGYAQRYRRTDLEASLGKVSVDPAQPQTVLHKFPALANDPLAVGTVSRILAAGVEATTLRKIVDNHPPSQQADVDKLLLMLDLLLGHNVVGWEKVVADLAVGGNLLRGATWVLRYIDQYGSWTDLTLEVQNPDAVNPKARRWDALMQGRLYEFKWWYAWTSSSSRTFLAQILNDYRSSRVGQDMPLRWVFGPSPLTRAVILDEMNAALDGVKADLLAGRPPVVDGYTPRIVNFIKTRLDDVVRVVTS